MLINFKIVGLIILRFVNFKALATNVLLLKFVQFPVNLFTCTCAMREIIHAEISERRQEECCALWV